MTSTTENLSVEPVTGALGADIRNIDLSRPLDAATVARIRQALLEFGVLFFHDQDLSVEQHKAFATRFGTLFKHPNILGSDTDPYVIQVVRTPGEKKIIGEDWHSDTTIAAEPPMGSLLYGVDVPPYGGDTMFANQYLAYDTLSDGLKKMLDGVRAANSDRTLAGPALGLNAGRATKVREDAAWRETLNFHPVFRTHPETGRKALYVNRMTSIHFEGMTEAESKPLLEYLFQHAHRPEFTCRFRWKKGCLAFWDNRCTQHIAINDTGSFPRSMRRLQIVGDRPY